MNKHIPRIVIAASSSGQGKTTLTCGLLGAMQRFLAGSQSHDESLLLSFKCGPDYIDPMFHETILDIPSENLDLFFLSEKKLRTRFIEKSSRSSLSIIEGVMGYYDGNAMTSDEASTWHVAKVLKAPVILVVNGRGKALSLAAEIKGFMEFRPDSMIQGVILNHVKDGMYPALKKMLEDLLEIKVLGYLPDDEGYRMESRYLGLTLPEEQDTICRKMELLIETASRTLDLPGILSLADSAPDLECSDKKLALPQYPITIGIAKDEAFSFYYRSNLELLKAYGAKLCYFSPIHDEKIPEKVDLLYFGGGYPELHMEELAHNVSMKQSIKEFYQDGGYIFAECGGFMYLHRDMKDQNGVLYPMAGLIDETAYSTDRLQRFGYITVNDAIRAHEFHYWNSTDPGSSLHCVKPDGKRSWNTGYCSERLIAGFPHYYFASCPQVVENIMKSIHGRLQLGV